MKTSEARVTLVELRVLDGPNLYFTRPAIKLTIAAEPWLAMSAERAWAMAAFMRFPGAGESAVRSRVRPGEPRTEQRSLFCSRVAAHVARVLARATETHLAVRARPGTEQGEIVVAYPWRRRDTAEAFGRALVELLDQATARPEAVASLAAVAAKELEGKDPGPPPSVPEPRIPVVAVTGTNGKTTTVRLLAHFGRKAGLHVAYSSTDGVYLDARRIEEGDYSGFSGAGMALSQEGVELAVLEIARGGILLRGIGTRHNDVAVVTNISADHLGLHGIHTLDQLAEVKSTILRITRPGGWDVLNADDPRVLGMRRVTRGRLWLFSLDPGHPAIRSALEENGRALTVVDGQLALLEPGYDPRPLVPLEEVPVTLSGISSIYTQNAMAAAAAGLGAGLPEEAVVEGLRTFVLDPETNPGRINLFEVEGRIVVVDYAHNEAGMDGLVEVCQGLRRPGREIWLAFGNAGDRSNDIIHGFGFRAGRGSDHAVIAEFPKYLRGRDPEDLVRRQTAAVVDAGKPDPRVFPGEKPALEWMLEASKPEDVVAVTAVAQRFEIFEMLEHRGGKRVGPDRVRELVRAARGQPEQGYSPTPS